MYYFRKSIYLWGYTDINGVAGKSVFVVEPHLKDADGKPVDVSRFEDDIEKIGKLYYMGYNDTLKLIPDIKKYLGIN